MQDLVMYLTMQTNHKKEVGVYDEAVYYGTAKWAILETCKDPPKGFEEVRRLYIARSLLRDGLSTQAGEEQGGRGRKNASLLPACGPRPTLSGFDFRDGSGRSAVSGDACPPFGYTLSLGGVYR